MKKLILSTFVLSLLISCSSKELNRGKALGVIEEFYSYPNVEIVRFPGVASNNKLNNEYQNLRAQKFITEKIKAKYTNEYWVIMTEKGNAFKLSGKPSYNGYQVASSILELNEVTGIRFDDGKNTAYVDYNLKRKNVTPFGKTKGFKDGDLIEKKTVIQLYDDGWRITSKKPKKIVEATNFKGFEKGYFENIDKVMNEITMETSNSPCFIKNIYEKYGRTFLTVDYIQLKPAEKDGYDYYKVINTNPKLRTFVLDSNTKLVPNISIEELKKSVFKESNEYNPNFFISVNNGNIINLQANTAG